MPHRKVTHFNEFNVLSTRNMASFKRTWSPNNQDQLLLRVTHFRTTYRKQRLSWGHRSRCSAKVIDMHWLQTQEETIYVLCL